MGLSLSENIFVVSLGSQVRPHIVVEEKTPEDIQPGIVLWEIVVKLGSDPLDLWQSRSGDVGEIVVLHVVTDVEREVVPWSIVRVRLVASIKHVVLSDKVCRHGVWTHTQEGTSDEIHQTFWPYEVVYEEIEYKLNHVVENFQFCGGFGTDETRSKGVEQWLEEKPEEFARRTAEETTLPVCGDIGIIQVNAQVAMVLHVVFLEGDRHGHTDGEVCPHSKQTVGQGVIVTKRNVVGCVVDGEC